MHEYNVTLVTKGQTRRVKVSACNLACAKSLAVVELKEEGVLAIATHVWKINK